MLFPEIQEIGGDLSLMKINLTKRKTIEKFEKNLKTYIINFKTIRYKLTALGNIIPLVPNYKLMRAVSNFRLPKEQKQAKTAKNQEKKLSEKFRRH